MKLAKNNNFQKKLYLHGKKEFHPEYDVEKTESIIPGDDGYDEEDVPRYSHHGPETDTVFYIGAGYFDL